MRYAILSDIHANYQSWRSILADIEEAGAETLVCLGDIVGYGPMPQAVLNEVRSLASGIVLGNHDAAVCGRIDSSIFNPKARTVIEWTRKRLDRGSIKFLKKLPLAIEDGDILFVHAETIEPDRFDYILDAPKATENLEACSHRVVFYGHTHHPVVFVQSGGVVGEHLPEDFTLEEGRRYLVNVGTAGEPRDPADLRAKYVLFDSEANSIQFRSVDFDADAYRADLEREGLSITPFFLRALDFAKGKYEPGTLRKERAMEPLKVARVGNAPAPRPLVRRLSAAPPKKSKTSLVLTILILLVIAGLLFASLHYFR